MSLTLHPVYRTGRSRLASNEHAHSGDRGPAGSWTAAGHPATRRRGAEPDPVPTGRIAIRAASSWCGVVPQQGPGLRTLLSGSGGQLGRTGRRQAGHSGQGRVRALKLQGLSWLKARRRRGVVREGCLDRREPSRIGVRYGRARCCRYGKGVPGCTLRMIGSSLGSTRDHDPRG